MIVSPIPYPNNEMQIANYAIISLESVFTKRETLLRQVIAKRVYFSNFYTIFSLTSASRDVRQ